MGVPRPYKHTVTMRELDSTVSKVARQAVDEPVTVLNRGVPYVWMVSHEQWLEAGGQLSDFVPPTHPLVPLSDRVMMLTHEQASMFVRLDQERRWSCPTVSLFRSLLLQVLYSIQSERQLYQEIRANLAYRWFIGKQYLVEKLMSRDEFEADIALLPRDAGVVDLLARALEHLPQFQLAEVQEFNVNRALLRAWQTPKN